MASGSCKMYAALRSKNENFRTTLNSLTCLPLKIASTTADNERKCRWCIFSSVYELVTCSTNPFHHTVLVNRQILANKSPYLGNGAWYDHSHNDGLIGSHICTFDWHRNFRPWMTLNCRYAVFLRTLYCRKDASFGAHCRNLNEYCQQQKCRPMTSFWKCKIHADIRRGSSGWGHHVMMWLSSTAIFGDFDRSFFGNLKR